jgi:aminopeptidase N
MAYDFLRQTLGDALFLKAMQTYMARWNGKHPIPTDFFFTFNEVVGKDLSWYFKPWFYEFAYPDLSITNVKQKKNYIVVEILNKGKLPLPVKLQVMSNDLMIKEIYKTPEVWSSGKNKIEVKIEGVKNFNAVILGGETIPDVNKVDNVYIK